MKQTRKLIVLLAIHLAVVLSVSAQTTEFSYQGFILDNNAPATGLYDIEFRLYSSMTGGSALLTFPRSSVPVSNGVFVVPVDFGDFPSTDRFLELAVRPVNSVAFTTLAPRSKILAVPIATLAKNAMLAANAGTASNALQLGGVNSTQFVQTTDPRMNDARNPLPNNSNYVQNRSATGPAQTATEFHISGDGTVGGILTGNIVSAATQFNSGSGRVLAKVGQNNLFLGTLTGAANGGIQNTMLGDAAGQDNTGNENTFVGFVAGQRNIAGINNSYFGNRAGKENTGGNNNTLIGYFTALGTNNLTNATAIGSNAMVEQSNSLVLGSITGVNGATQMTDVGIGVTQPARRLDVNGIIRVGATTGTIGCIEDRDGTVIAGTCASDLRFKKNVTPFSSVLENFSKLRPVNYFWRTDEFGDQHWGTKRSFGLIAQDVEKLFPELVTMDEKGYRAVNYSKLPLYTIQAVKELKAENDALTQKLEQQQSQIDELKKIVESIKGAR